MIRRFASLTALHAEAERQGVFSSRLRDSGSWYGNETVEQTNSRTLVGDRSLVRDAELLLSKLDSRIEVARPSWHRNVAGPICVVPDVLSGSPTPFRRLRHESDERAPITVLCNIVSSAAISADVLMRRGTAVLALVMALVQVRPVTLHVVATLDGYRDKSGETIFSTQIATAPLDLARACYALTSQGFCRFLNYELGRKLNDFQGGWPHDYRYGSAGGGEYSAYLAKMLSPNPSRTLVIDAAQARDPIVTEPIKWINEQVHRFTSQQESAA